MIAGVHRAAWTQPGGYSDAKDAQVYIALASSPIYEFTATSSRLQ